MSPVEVKLTINEGLDGNTIENIPENIWQSFKERAKKNFPSRGDDAWAFFLSEVILSVGGGTEEVVSYFMTDVPRANAEALEETLGQANISWDKFHAYLLTVATRPGHLRVINFTAEDKQQYGTFIATGIPLKAFVQLEQMSAGSVEDFMAALFMAAADGVVTLTGTLPKRENLPL